ncbi:MAG: transporter substrate-binding domain-containing protein [Lachnospiraceae bacterium]|nr:transporter substrate-binding domain-containing protein [Lachnospiraceae bacterium]
MRRQMSVMMAVMMTGITLAGCSGKPESTAATTTAAAATETAAVAETTAAAAKGMLKVGSDCTFAPFEYEENGAYTGFDIELVDAVAKEMGYDGAEIVNTEFKGLIPGLNSNKFDLIASAMYITDERKETIDFSDSYFPGGLSIMVLKDNADITGPDDLKGKSVAVQVGTKSVTYLEENYPDVTRVEVEQNSEMFLQLETGKVDAVVTGRPAAMVYAKESGKVKVLDTGLTDELYGYGIRKGDTELADGLNTALKALKDNGTYDEIKAKWFE